MSPNFVAYILFPLGQGEMAQWLKHLLCEDNSWDL